MACPITWGGHNQTSFICSAAEIANYVHSSNFQGLGLNSFQT